jgi:signal transduction histidine kinase/CheY-like chemotaxis protein
MTEPDCIPKHYLDREREARKQAEFLLESKSRELYEANQELMNLAAGLEHRVRERTRELQSARDEAIQANSTKSVFLANVSHELRTPLNAIIGMAELMTGDNLTERQQECADIIRTSAEVLLERINELLDLTKIEAGQLELESIPFDPVELLDQIVTMLAEKAQNKDLDILQYVHPSVPSRLIGDPGRIRQIFTNLINNAIKFTDTGAVSVTIPSLDSSSNGLFLHGMVLDTGIGIAKDQQKIIFDPFRQADSSIARIYGGTGLGLSITRRLIQAMQGKITVDSEPGKGTAFHFCMRVEPADTVTANLVPDPLMAGHIAWILTSRKWGGQNIALMLKDFGIRAVVVHAINQLNDTIQINAAVARPDWILMDCGFYDHLFSGILDMVSDASSVPPSIFLLCPISSTHSQCPLVGKTIAGLIRKPVTHQRLQQSLMRRLDSGDGIHGPKSPVNAPDRIVPGARAVPEKRQSVSILVVDDNRINRLVLSRQVENLGISAKMVDCGRAAIESVQRNFFPLILMDVEMPEMDGLETTRRIRSAEPPTIHHIIIAMTAHAMSEHKTNCIEAGMDDFLSKPVKLEILKAMLKKWLPEWNPELGKQ